MAFLRFDESECEVRGDLSAPKVVVELGLVPAAREKLREALNGLVLREGSEVRADFPAGWTIFWKLRDGESRFLLAHPEHDQWVATLALSASHLVSVRDRLGDGFTGSLSGLEGVARMSNVDVLLGIR